MSFKYLVKISPLRWVLYQLALWRVQEKLLEIIPYLDFTDRILDVGSGNCVLNQQLRIRGYNIVPFDVENFSFVEGIVPILYDGTDMPFQSDSFDMAIVITVLHHAKNPDAILLQLSKVAKRIIIIEEIYENNLDKHLTYLIDSLFNCDFIGHSHSNRSDDGWRSTFKKLNLDICSVKYSKSLFFLKRVTYLLEREKKVD